MALNRSDQILKFIVEYFIKTAQPVGSQTIIDEYHLPYSSATIRNEMFALEKMGLIEKTHSSSGRVPSAQGYKYYCEKLRDNSVDEELKYSLQQVLQEKTKSVEEVIKASCEILSHMTSLVSVVMGPDENKEYLAKFGTKATNEKELVAWLKDLIKHKGPFYIHCIEGKDRTGFVCALLEAFMGASLEEIEADYMRTYRDYFGVTKESDPETYALLYELKFLDIALCIAGVHSEKQLGNAKLMLSARRYLMECGLTFDEWSKLWYLLSGGIGTVTTSFKQEISHVNRFKKWYKFISVDWIMIVQSTLFVILSINNS